MFDINRTEIIFFCTFLIHLYFQMDLSTFPLSPNDILYVFFNYFEKVKDTRFSCLCRSSGMKLIYIIIFSKLFVLHKPDRNYFFCTFFIRLYFQIDLSTFPLSPNDILYVFFNYFERVKDTRFSCLCRVEA